MKKYIHSQISGLQFIRIFKTIKSFSSHVWSNSCYFPNIKINQSDHIVVYQNQCTETSNETLKFSLKIYFIHIKFSFPSLLCNALKKKKKNHPGQEMRSGRPGRTGSLSILRTLSQQVLKPSYSYSFVLDSLLLLYISMFSNVTQFIVTKACL